MKIAIIGGGAAGFFAAFSVKVHHPGSQVVIFEKSNKLLSKVKISGGGKCNVTNACFSISKLCKAYPRGGKFLKNAFQEFNTKHTMDWFESREVPLMVREDDHVFPKSLRSSSIINCFIDEADKLGIEIEEGRGIDSIKKKSNTLELYFSDEDSNVRSFDKVIVASGGSPKRRGLEWLEELGHKIEDPVPSLFTFNMSGEPILKLNGVVAENALVSIQGSKLKAEGPLLITHWGMSGPAILKLSSFGARILRNLNYDFKVQVNWVNESNNDEVYAYLKNNVEKHPNKLLSNNRPYSLPERLWLHLLGKVELSAQKKWGDLGKKGLNKITSVLCNDVYEVKGKTTFKEEFVTCGGVSLETVNSKTMESRVCKNLYFAGEVMDIDAITGGYNFQAAWTTGFIAGKLSSN